MATRGRAVSIEADHDAALESLDVLVNRLVKERDAALAVLRDLLEERGVPAFREKLVRQVEALGQMVLSDETMHGQFVAGRISGIKGALAWLDEATGNALRK